MNSKPIALLTAATLGAAACIGDEKYHIEQRQFEPEPETTRAIWVSTFSGSQATLNYSGSRITTKMGPY